MVLDVRTKPKLTKVASNTLESSGALILSGREPRRPDAFKILEALTRDGCRQLWPYTSVALSSFMRGVPRFTCVTMCSTTCSVLSSTLLVVEHMVTGGTPSTNADWVRGYHVCAAIGYGTPTVAITGQH